MVAVSSLEWLGSAAVGAIFATLFSVFVLERRGRRELKAAKRLVGAEVIELLWQLQVVSGPPPSVYVLRPGSVLPTDAWEAHKETLAGGGGAAALKDADWNSVRRFYDIVYGVRRQMAEQLGRTPTADDIVAGAMHSETAAYSPALEAWTAWTAAGEDADRRLNRPGRSAVLRRGVCARGRLLWSRVRRRLR